MGDGHLDHAFWGRPEDMTMPRPAYQVNKAKPGSDVAGQTTAAFVAGYLAFKDVGKNNFEILTFNMWFFVRYFR